MLIEIFADPERAKSVKAMQAVQAMMTIVKIDSEQLKLAMAK